MKNGGYNPNLDRVVHSYGEIEIEGKTYIIEIRQYGNSDPKLIFTNTWESFRGPGAKRMNGMPPLLAAYVARKGIIEDFVRRVTGKTPAQAIELE